MSELKKYVEITPSHRDGFDSIIIPAGMGWSDILEVVEQVLDSQFSYLEENEETWADIKVSIQCREMTEEAYSELVDCDQP